MRQGLTCLAAGLAMATGACRDVDGGDPVDARPPVDAIYDGCGYRESLTGSEDEPTGLTVGPATVSVCGTIATVTPSDGFLELDSYRFTVGQAGLYRFRLEALDALGTPTHERTTDVEVLGAQISGVPGRTTHGLYIDDQGLFVAELPAGETLLWVYGMAAIRPQRETAYQVTISPDAPAVRCPAATGAADHVESHDGADHRGNDVFDVNTSVAATVTDTPRPDDAAEPTGLTVGAGQVRMLAGTSAAVPPVGASTYRDRDAFTITTGPTTHELDLHLTWTGGAADLDLMTIDADGWLPGLVTGGSTTGPQHALLSVRQSATYQIWIGARHDVAAVLPVSYQLTICGR
jgi:hypothetical protein